MYRDASSAAFAPRRADERTDAVTAPDRHRASSIDERGGGESAAVVKLRASSLNIESAAAARRGASRPSSASIDSSAAR
jgi:hypothetical protein